MLLCQHEKIAVQVAHGYAKVTGEPLAVIVHNVVGMLHSVMGIYYAYIDRAPIFIIGATGPMDEGKRRPWIDWIHTANVQGEQLRNYVKWDYQPGSIDGVVDSFARAYSVMMTEPQGPIYMCYDAALQEAPLAAPVTLPDPGAAKTPSRIAPDPAALEKAAERILAADWPVLMPEFVGRASNGFSDMVALAETLGAPVADVGTRLNFPTEHPLDLRITPEVYKRADVMVGLDLRNWERPTHYNDRINRTKQSYYPADCEWIDIGFADIEISKWAMDYQKFPECSHRVLADTALAIPQLTAYCRDRIAGEAALRRKVNDRRNVVGAMHDTPAGGMARAGEGELGRLADIARPFGQRGLGADQTRGLGPDRQRLRAMGAEALGFRPALSPRRQGARRRHADRHRAGRRTCTQGQRAARRRLPDRRRPDVRRGRAVVRHQAPDPDASRDAQQPRLLQRLGAPDHRRQAAQHSGRARLYRHGHFRAGAGLRHARALLRAGTRRDRSISRATSPGR